MADDGGKSPVTLDYSAGPSRWRRRRWWLASALLICAAGAATWHWGPAVRNHAQFRYLQWQCLTYSGPPDRVVYESDPALVPGMLTMPGYFTPEMQIGMRGSNYHGPPPVDPSRAVYRAAVWDEFVAMTGIAPLRQDPSRPIQTAICFLGEVRTPSGKRRLVVVACFPFGRGPGWANSWAMLRGISITPGDRITSPMNYNESKSMPSLVNDYGSEPPNVRVYAGQRDPNKAHFTIRYVVHGQESMVDGSVDDAGNVKLDLRLPIPQPRGGPRARNPYQ